MKHKALTSLIAAIGSMAVLTTSAFAGEVMVDKNPLTPEEPTKWYSASLSLAYDSMYIFRGVSVIGHSADDGIVSSTLTGTYSLVPNTSLTTGVWWANGFADSYFGDVYQELDAYITATYSLGPVDLSFGYIYYLFPQSTFVAPGVTYDTHELNYGISYTALPYVTPSLTYYQDIGNFQGGYMEFKLVGDIPVYGDIVSLNPMFWTSVDFGSVRKTYLFPNGGVAGTPTGIGGAASFNDIGIGLQANVKVNEVMTFSAYVKADFPVGIGQTINENYVNGGGSDGQVVWAGCSWTFSF